MVVESTNIAAAGSARRRAMRKIGLPNLVGRSQLNGRVRVAATIVKQAHIHTSLDKPEAASTTSRSAPPRPRSGCKNAMRNDIVSPRRNSARAAAVAQLAMAALSPGSASMNESSGLVSSAPQTPRSKRAGLQKFASLGKVAPAPIHEAGKGSSPDTKPRALSARERVDTGPDGTPDKRTLVLLDHVSVAIY